jgi:multiple sugar transport system substrate-binding protein
VPFTLGTAPFPTFGDKPRKMSSGGSFIGVYAREEAQQKAAWEFLKFALSEEGYTIWMKTGYLNASTYDLPILEGQEAAYTQLEEGLSRETAWPSARGGEAQAAWGTYCERIWANDISAEEGCKMAVEEIAAIIGQ